MAIKVNPKLVKLSGGYGLMAAGLTVVAFLVFYYMGQEPWKNLLSLIMDVVLIGVVTFVATRDFRDNENGGELRFYHGMTIGFIIYMCTAMLFSLFYLLFITVIVPDFMEIFRASLVEELESKRQLIVEGFSEEEFQGQLDKLQENTPSQLALSAFFWKIISGLFLAPIFSIVLRTPQR